MKKLKGYVQYIKEYKEDEDYLYPKYRYHWGDLGKGFDTYSIHLTGQNRGTGHFGTGTYFVTDKHIPSEIIKHKKDNVGHNTDNRPLHKIDFSKYNLYNAFGKRGITLHDISKRIADIGWAYANDERYNDNQPIIKEFIRLYDDTKEFADELDYEINHGYLVDEFNGLSNDEFIDKWTEKELKLYKHIFEFINTDDNLDKLVLSVDISQHWHNVRDYPKIKDSNKYSISEIDKLYKKLKENPPKLKLNDELKEIISKLNNLGIKTTSEIIRSYIEKDKKDRKDRKLTDTVFTKIMKDNKYNGVDIGNFESLDNFGYGSVIYNLMDEDKENSKPLNIQEKNKNNEIY